LIYSIQSLLNFFRRPRPRENSPVFAIIFANDERVHDTAIHRGGESRTQATLFPERLDDWITADNPLRAVEAFVDELATASTNREQLARSGI
jgi:hypothetical protein